MKFDMVTNPPPEIAGRLSDETDAISDSYFTIDTASADVVGEWVKFNRHMVTYALHDGNVLGFFNIMPLTLECGALFERQAIKEEDLRVSDILPYEALPHAQYAYLAAIAVKNTRNYFSRQCVAAMMATVADHLLNGYGPGFKKLFANPTTFNGNHMVRKLGLRPVQTINKGLVKENDIYVTEMNDQSRANLAAMSRRYARFVGDNPWKGAL